jgi:hypothetical protein
VICKRLALHVHHVVEIECAFGSDIAARPGFCAVSTDLFNPDAKLWPPSPKALHDSRIDRRAEPVHQIVFKLTRIENRIAPARSGHQFIDHGALVTPPVPMTCATARSEHRSSLPRRFAPAMFVEIVPCPADQRLRSRFLA